ncbi:MAG: CDP-diacylglycerol--serine O-phosphatidyltransferase [Rhodospirillales bacterium]|nr:CDP-diacylglycerol--serine O-phosphatidyltransferase [Rhodospirillales bacterium]
MTDQTEPKKNRSQRLKELPFNRMIPNILTLLALAAGLTSIRYALLERWEHAVLSLVVAAVLDTMDGRVARLLKGASRFGAELDSLSDFVCFGVSPALILYLWAMQDAGRTGWILVMLFAMCCGLRLARFNVTSDDEQAPAWKANFFTGVPAPAGAGLVLLPLILSFQVETELFRDPWVVSAFLFVVGGLLVSSLPTFSFKKLKISRNFVLPTMLIVALIAAFSVSVPWLTLSSILGLYLCTFAFSYRLHHKYESEAKGPVA